MSLTWLFRACPSEYEYEVTQSNFCSLATPATHSSSIT